MMRSYKFDRHKTPLIPTWWGHTSFIGTNLPLYRHDEVIKGRHWKHSVHKPQAKQKTPQRKLKRGATRTPHKTRGEPRCSWKASSSCVSQDTRHDTHIYSNTVIQERKNLLKSKRTIAIWLIEWLIFGI